jgi:hypothetical protein
MHLVPICCLLLGANCTLSLSLSLSLPACQVHDLPKTMHMVKWNYGSLGPEQEKEFVARRLEMLGFEPDELGQAAAVELICCCQEAIREFAAEHIFKRFQHHHRSTSDKPLPTAELRASAESHARSVVSLRDIQRVFDLVSFFKSLEGIVKGHKDGKVELETRRAMLLTTAVVYLLRLSPEYRVKCVSRIEALPTERSQPLRISPVLEEAIWRAF